MNCGQAAGDPRSNAERKLLCDDCLPAPERRRDVAGILHFLTPQQMAEEIVRLDAIIAGRQSNITIGRVPMSRESRAMLLNVLWHHQGGSSPAGQPLRKVLGIGQHDHLTEEQLCEARWIDSLLSLAARGAEGEPPRWQFTGPGGLKRFLTQKQYDAQTPGTQKWYRPICEKCGPAGAAGRASMTDAACEAIGKADKLLAEQEPEQRPARRHLAEAFRALTAGMVASEPCRLGKGCQPDPTCTNRHQCWEPCGELGKSADHARPAGAAIPPSPKEN